jgi:type I restriction enzyme S subunit
MFQELPLSELCLLISRGVSPAYDEVGIPVLSQRCIRENRVLFEVARFTNPLKKRVPIEKMVRLHDVLVNSTGVGTLGRVAQVKRIEGNLTVDSHVSIVRPDSAKIDSIFFGYAMVFNQPKIEAMGEGATGQTELSRTRLGNETRIPVPKIQVQKRIAAILSAYDELNENSQRRIKILEDMARNLYREWFDHLRFPDHEIHPRVASALGEIPKGWEVKKVKDILARRPAGLVYRDADVRSEGGVPVIDQSTSELLGFHDNAADHNASAMFPMAIFGDHTCKMQLLIEPFSIGPNVVPFTASEKLPTAFVFYAVNSLVQTQEYKRHWSALNTKEIVVPDTALSQKFADLIQPMLAQQAILRNSIRNLRRTRDLLLPRLLSGQIDVEKTQYA